MAHLKVGKPAKFAIAKFANCKICGNAHFCLGHGPLFQSKVGHTKPFIYAGLRGVWPTCPLFFINSQKNEKNLKNYFLYNMRKKVGKVGQDHFCEKFAEKIYCRICKMEGL